MKKLIQQPIVLTVFTLCFSVFSASAQCELDTTLLDTSGVFPSRLADGEVGVAYDQTIHFVFPTELSIFVAQLNDTLEVNLCSYSLDSIPNLPTGLSFSCNTGDCSWDMNFDSGFVNRGCVQLTGTPETGARPDDSLRIFLTITPGQVDTANNCVALELPPELIGEYAIQEFRVPFFVSGDTLPEDTLNTALLPQLDREAFQVSVYPNPSIGNTTLEFVLQESQQVSVEVVNQLGQQIHKKPLTRYNAGKQQMILDSQTWPTGVYFVRMKFGNSLGQISTKLRVE